MAGNPSILVKDYLNSKNIKMMNGSPYSPHSQGVVERIHLTIRYAFIIKIIYIQKDLPIIMKIYNNTIHRTTKHAPTEIFYNKNSELFEEVYKIL